MERIKAEVFSNYSIFQHLQIPKLLLHSTDYRPLIVGGSDLQVSSLFVLGYFESNLTRNRWQPFEVLAIDVTVSRVTLVRSIARYAHLMNFVE
jgi:hypothetical protein